MEALKPIDRLSEQDLLTCPIWTYATDSEEEVDETYVRPFDGELPTDPNDYSVFQVACDLRFASGFSCIGFLEFCAGQPHFYDPIAVGSEGEYWPLNAKPSRREVVRFERFFGGPYSSLFPVLWTLRIVGDDVERWRTGVYEPILV